MRLLWSLFFILSASVAKFRTAIVERGPPEGQVRQERYRASGPCQTWCRQSCAEPAAMTPSKVFGRPWYSP